jgi:hypothetical protein
MIPFWGREILACMTCFKEEQRVSDKRTGEDQKDLSSESPSEPSHCPLAQSTQHAQAL